MSYNPVNIKIFFMNISCKSLLWIILFLQAPAAVFCRDTTPAFTPGACPLRNCPGKKDKSVMWGTVLVPQSDQPGDTSRVKLEVVVLKCTRDKNAPALFILGGGPGASTIDIIWLWMKDTLRSKYDIVLCDQRGTGHSRPRLCPFLSDSIFSIMAGDHTMAEETELRIASAKKCRDSLSQRSININSYSSRQSVEDLEYVRRALGYDRISLLGISYGTRLALTYMREHPASLKSVILDSSVPPDGKYFEGQTANLQRSVDKICASCIADPACNNRYPDLKNKIADVVRDLDKRPLTVEWNDGPAKKKFVVNSQDFVLGLHQALYQADLIPLIPAMIEAFHRRNREIIAAFVSVLGGQIRELDYGTYYSVMCNETLPFNDVKRYTEISAGSAAFPAGIGFYASEFGIYGSWPPVSPDSVEGKAVSSDVPTLVMAGEFDPVTPPRNGELVCKTLPNSYFVELPLKSHGVSLVSESKNIMLAFLNDPSHRPAVADAAVPHVNPAFITDVYITGGVFNALVSLSDDKAIIYLSLLVFLIGAFSLFLLGLLAYLVIARWKPQWRRPSTKEKRILTAGGLISLFALVYLGGMVYSINASAGINGYLPVFGLPGYAWTLVLLSLAVVVLSAVLLYGGISIFRDRLLTKYWRVMYVLLMLACIVYTGLIVDWKMY
jgi:pimeloyl-ACP methyl ester carboxylesterase